MPQQTSTFESHFLTHMQGVAGAYHKVIACSWVPILQVGGLGKVWVNCFPKAITTWLGWESNPRPPDPESDALTTLPRCPYSSSDRLQLHYRCRMNSGYNTNNLFQLNIPRGKFLAIKVNTSEHHVWVVCCLSYLGLVMSDTIAWQKILST